MHHHIKFGVKYKRKWCAWNERNRGRPTSRSLFEVVFLMLLARDRVFVNGMVIISSSFERMLLLLLFFFSISGTSLLIGSQKVFKYWLKMKIFLIYFFILLRCFCKVFRSWSKIIYLTLFEKWFLNIYEFSNYIKEEQYCILSFLIYNLIL